MTIDRAPDRHDRIRVLLVDDMPTFTRDANARSPLARYPALPDELTNHFELIWIQDALEARWLLDAFEILSLRAPTELLGAGFPPEIVIFDYALTQGVSVSRSEADPSYRLHVLGELLNNLSIQLLPPHPNDQDEPPYTGAPFGGDRTGCYIGGELARAFGTHPCGSVPTTAHANTAESDAAFYEWLNRNHFMGLFEHKSRGTPTWQKLLPPAVRSLRQRILHLASAGLVRVQLETVQQLAGDPSTMINSALVFHSRYGRRALPIQGLFFDQLNTEESRPNSFSETAQQWAELLLKELFRGHGQDNFNAAKRLAAQYWDAYLSEASAERYELSDLAASKHRSPAQEDTLKELCSRVGVGYFDVTSAPEDVLVTKPGFVLEHCCNGAQSEIVARWTALMVAVRAEQHHRLATEEGVRFLLLRAKLSDEDRIEGEIVRGFLEDRLGKEQVESLIRIYKGQRRHYHNEEYIELPITRAAELDDVLIALDPLPDTLFTFLNKKIVNERRTKDVGKLTNALKRLGLTGKSWGTLGLNMSDVLENHPFDCEFCKDAINKDIAPADHQDSAVKYHHGIRKGEGALLRTYADELGFPEEKWPFWLRDAP